MRMRRDLNSITIISFEKCQSTGIQCLKNVNQTHLSKLITRKLQEREFLSKTPGPKLATPELVSLKLLLYL